MTPSTSSKRMPEPGDTPSPTRKKANVKTDSPTMRLLSKNTLNKLAKTARSKLYKKFQKNPDMPDPNTISDEVLETIIQSERAYQAITTHAQRFARVVSSPLDLIGKLGDNDAQMTTYLEKPLPEARRDQTNLELACTKISWRGTEEVLNALFASESDGIYFMALLQLKGQQWWKGGDEEFPIIEMERKHLAELLFYTARDWASWFPQAKHPDFYLVTRWLATNLSSSVVHALTVTEHPQPERNLILMVAFSEVIPLKFIRAREINGVEQVDHDLTLNEEVVVPVIDALRRGACRPSTEEEIDNQVRFRSRHRHLSSRQNKNFIPNVSYGPFVNDDMAERAEVTAFDLKGRFWSEYQIEQARPGTEKHNTGTSLDSPVGMETTAFHPTFGQDGDPIQLTIPGTSTVVKTNSRFLELVNEPTKLPCPLQKIHELRRQEYERAKTPKEPGRWTLTDPKQDGELALSEEHVTDALDRVFSRMNTASFKVLSENRRVQFIALEIMKGTLRQRDPENQTRYKRELQNRLVAARAVTEDAVKRNANLLSDKEPLMIPCVTDLHVRDEEGRTLLSQYFSPPRCLRLIESESAEDLRDELERNVGAGELNARLLNGRDEPVAPHVMVPGRPPTDGVEPTHPMRRDLAMLEPLILCPGKRTPQSIEHYVEKYPCSCWARELMKTDRETLLVCWDLSELLVIGLPETLSKVVILPLPSLLAVQWMLQNIESFHYGQKATVEQISNLGKLNLSLFESFARLMDLPG